MKLLGSSDSKENLTRIVNDYFYSKAYVLNDNGTISNASGPRLGVAWELKNGRYRFLKTGVLF